MEVHKVVFTSLVGDLFHVGHLNLLKKAKEMGSTLIVGVLVDDVVEKYKRRPIIPDVQRVIIIRALACVDDAFIQNTLEPDHEFLARGVDVIVHGDDWKSNFPGAEYMRSIGKVAVNIPYYSRQSTTKIIDEVIRRHYQ